jgi:raffinose/stachyose/melibiose transport system permease protein
MDELFKAVGLGGAVQLWLADVHVVFWTVFLVLTWQYIGFGIVLLLAGLQGIPKELHEAAAIDGATPWQATRLVTLPLLGPTIRVWVFINVIGALQIFDINYILTGGGPAGASSTVATYMIQYGFRSLEFGYGAAIAVILFVFCFVFAILWQRFAMRRDMAGALTRAVN